jgi:F-type H+-transporting ATPase subunit b
MSDAALVTTDAEATHGETLATSEHAAPDTGLLGTFGIKPELLLAQLLNFAVVMAVLYFFVYKKLLASMDSRATKIEKGLADAEHAAVALRTADMEKTRVLAEARAAAGVIVAEGERRAAEERAAAAEKARAEVELVIARGKEEIALDRAKAAEEVKAEMARLLAYAMEKLASEKLDPAKDGAKIAAAIDAARKRV